jgi:hypothetical protein
MEPYVVSYENAAAVLSVAHERGSSFLRNFRI